MERRPSASASRPAHQDGEGVVEAEWLQRREAAARIELRAPVRAPGAESRGTVWWNTAVSAVPVYST